MGGDVCSASLRGRRKGSSSSGSATAVEAPRLGSTFSAELSFPAPLLAERYTWQDDRLGLVARPQRGGLG